VVLSMILLCDTRSIILSIVYTYIGRSVVYHTVTMCMDVSMSVGSVIIHLSIGVIFVCLYMTMWLRGFFGDRVEFFYYH
jgi:hypothetical protein